MADRRSITGPTRVNNIIMHIQIAGEEGKVMKMMQCSASLRNVSLVSTSPSECTALKMVDGGGTGSVQEKCIAGRERSQSIQEIEEWRDWQSIWQWYVRIRVSSDYD